MAGMYALHVPITLMYNSIMASPSSRRRRARIWAEQSAAASYRLSDLRPFDGSCIRYEEPTNLLVSFHDGLEVGVTLEGSCDIDFDGTTVPHEPGDVWLIGIWEPHTWRVTRRRSTILSVGFLPEFIGDEVLPTAWHDMFTCDPADRPSVPDGEMRSTVLQLGREMAREIKARRDDWRIGARLTLAKLLFVLHREWRLSLPIPPKPQGQISGLRRIAPALRAIHSRPVERVSLPDAAARCGLSTAQFSRLFARNMGLSFGRFRTRAHLAFAAHLLLTTDLSIDAIAAESGFTDASHLHRLFVKHYKATPGEFRLQFR